jgi:hypothetical protein
VKIMKKLSIVCAFALIFGLVSAPVYAQTFCKDILEGGNAGGWTGAKSWDESTTISPSDTITVDLWINGVSEPYISGGILLSYDTTKVKVTSVTVGADWMLPSTFINNAVGNAQIVGGMVIGSVAPDGDGDIYLGQADVHCEAVGDALLAVTNPPGSFNCGVSSTCYDPLPTNVITIHQWLPPCSCDVTPSDVTVDVSVETSVDFAAAASGNCLTPITYVWSDDCSWADVDASGHLVASVPIGITENCRVTVDDALNTVTCGADVELRGPAACKMKIYRGGTCAEAEVIDDPAYNRPGRRGLALTCCETVTFCICTDCVYEVDPCDCLIWDFEIVEGPDGYTEDDLTLIIEPDCMAATLDAINCPASLTVIKVSVTDICNGMIVDEVYVTLGRVALGLGDHNAHPQTETLDVDLLLWNIDHHVKAIQTDICACDDELCKAIDNQPACEDDGDAIECKWDSGVCVGVDNIECTACVIDENRTPEYICSANEITDPADDGFGCCRVILFTTEPDDLIQQGTGAIARIKYDVLGELSSHDSVCIIPNRSKASDRFGEYLCVCPKPGNIDFWVCGDVYPQDCYACTTCGDGIVDLFDILEEIDIILGLQIATDCQMIHGDVPNGTPPHCGTAPEYDDCEADGVIDIFDALVIIDKALGKMNCCDYCDFGLIF